MPTAEEIEEAQDVLSRAGLLNGTLQGPNNLDTEEEVAASRLVETMKQADDKEQVSVNGNGVSLPREHDTANTMTSRRARRGERESRLREISELSDEVLITAAAHVEEQRREREQEESAANRERGNGASVERDVAAERGEDDE